MGNPASHFPDPEAYEQVSKGVETGFDGVNPFVLLDEIASGWNERDRLDAILLRAICRLSMEQPTCAQEGFTPWDLVEAIGKLRGKVWSSTDNNKDQMSDDVRNQWKKLKCLWDAKIEGLTQQFTDKGLKWIPQLAKTEGGGTGRPTRYRIDWIQPEYDQNTAQGGVSLNPSTDRQSGEVRYICEDIEDAGPIARIFARGYPLSGWRKALFVLAILAPLLFCWLLLVQVMVGLTASVIAGTNAINGPVLSLIVIYIVVWFTIGALLELGVYKIVLAPWWMQSVDNDRLLEHRSPPRHVSKNVKAVRYTATCPICGGKVAAKSGGMAFRGRIVGRCEEAPVEHVFSFDHITRTGRCLR